MAKTETFLQNNGFFDEGFGNEWEIVRQPGVDSPLSGPTLVIPLARCTRMKMCEDGAWPDEKNFTRMPSVMN
jgi:hypothetical protein